eukprot:g4437.t1
MSDHEHGKGPAPKKAKQVLLGAWLNQSGRSSADAIDINAMPTATAASAKYAVAGAGGAGKARGSGAAWGAGESIGGGGGLGDGWAKYEAPRGNRRSGSSISASSSHINNNSSSDSSAASASYNNNNTPYTSGDNRAAYSKKRGPPSVQTAARAAAPAGSGSSSSRETIDLADDDDVEDVGVKGQAKGDGAGSGGEGGEAEAEVEEGLSQILEGLCEEQRHVIDLVLKGKSVFFTGAAGTGKSFLLKKLHQALRYANKGPNTFMTGTTGKAAVGIGGCTIHSFAGIGLGKESTPELVGRVQRSRNAQKRWGLCEVLVIDEISMMEADLFDKLNIVAQRMKGNSRPFGGVQLVLCGDFFQLPPVGIGRGSTKFCFQAKTWDTSLDQSIVLKQVFRQKDPFFLKILHEMREGRVSPEAEKVLADKVEQCRFERYQRTHEVSAAQAAAAAVAAAAAAEAEAEAEAEAMAAEHEGDGGGDAFAPLPESGATGGMPEDEDGQGGGGGGPPAEVPAPPPPPPPVPSYTRLFSKNEDVDRLNVEELGKLQGHAEFYDATDSGDPMYLKQLQKHCAAGERIELKIGAKVLLLKNLDSSSQLVNGATGVVTEFVEASGRRLPKVEFDTMEGEGKVTTVIREEEWSVSLGDREMARRVQLPLRLAWALSVHKSQGMTIANVMVSTQGMFEYGQAYVALSRATTLDGLHLLDFRVGVVKAHESVKNFYAGLERRASAGGAAARGVTAVPRWGKPPPEPGGWISRSTASSRSSARPPYAQASSFSGGARAAGGTAAPARGGAMQMSPAARARMEANRRRAMDKLAEKKRAKAALEAASPASERLGLGSVLALIPCTAAAMKPQDVVPEYRRRAWIVWAGLLLALTGYAVWQVYIMIDKYDNPSINTTVQNEFFFFPVVTVCLEVGAGCSQFKDCVTTARDMSNVWVENHGSGDASHLITESKHEGCIAADLSQHHVIAFETATIELNWNTTGGSVPPTTSTSSSSAQYGAYSEHVFVYLNDAEPDVLDDTSSFLQVPYQIITSTTTETSDSYLVIGKTEKRMLDGDVVTYFPALTLSQSKYVFGEQDGFIGDLGDGDSFAQMYLSMHQGPFSLITITELDPRDVGALLGNVGGFWELLIVAWGVFFVLKKHEPAFVARTFNRPRQNKAASKAVSRPRVDADGEERPAWDKSLNGGENERDGYYARRGTASVFALSGRPQQQRCNGTGNADDAPPPGGSGKGLFSAFLPGLKSSARSLDNTEQATASSSLQRAVELDNPVRVDRSV